MTTMTSPENGGGNYITSYDTGNKPFKHDSARGKWSSEWDFNLSCISHAFGIVNFSVLPVFIMMHGGVLFIIPYAICLFLFVLPIFIIHSFLGQFSSTGFISAYRISPLFKGIGYIILFLNIVAASVHSVTTSYSLSYFFSSFSPDLPWMSCNHTWNTDNCTEVFTNETDYQYFDISWSSTEYFEFKILNFNDALEYTGYVNSELRFSWPIFGSLIVVWIIITLILYDGKETIMKYIKYSAMTILSLLILFFMRFICLPGALEGVKEYLIPSLKEITSIPSWFGSPIVTVLSFGSGWGTILTMASFNTFKIDIMKNAIIINIGIFIASLLAALIATFASEYMKEHLHYDILYYHYHPLNFIFNGFPYLFGSIEMSHFWSILFFLMLTLCELNAVVIILFSTLRSLFDEYEYLRNYKLQVSLGFPFVLFIFSTIFATNHGYEIQSILTRLCGASQMGICFLELIIVVWIYGRLRFQRDIQFMLGKTFSTWKFYLVRFITPLFVLFVMLFYFFASLLESWGIHLETRLILLGVKVLPWLFIPSYVIYKLLSTSGTCKVRFLRCTRPNDWYPADANDRQRYEETLGSSEISHQLVNMTVMDDDD